MKKINILITGAGAPGIIGTIYSLKHNTDNRPINIIGTDVKEEVVGKYVCDSFYKIPPANKTDNYLEAISLICKKEKVDILIPQNTLELGILSEQRDNFHTFGTEILVSSKNAIENSNNKLKLMQLCKENSIPVGNFYLVNNITELKKYLKILGWPNKKVVIKPPVSNGLRGVRIIDENYDPKTAFYSEKPNNLITNLKNIEEILGEEFPELIVTEYLTGDEYTVDLFRRKDKIVVIPRIREMIRSGITFNGKVVKHDKIIQYSEILARELDLEFCFGFQFKLDDKGEPKILESNPRVQGTMVLSTFANANVIWLSVKSILGEEIEIPEVKWDTRLLRYWGGVVELNGNKIGQL